MSTKLLIVGLGNPGINYNHTRHNLGASWLKALCLEQTVELQLNSKLNSYIVNLVPNIIGVLPNCYMNECGNPIYKVLDYYKLEPTNMLVVHDELDFAVGVIKLKLFGGHGGHNGLRSIIEILKTDRFKRLRIGIGRPEKLPTSTIANYVLDQPTRTEQRVIDLAVAHSFKIIPSICQFNWQQAIQILDQQKT